MDFNGGYRQVISVITTHTTFSSPEFQQSIGISLTPYYYYPHLVELISEEMERYEELSAKIAQMAGRDDESVHQSLKLLLPRRTELLNRIN